MVSMAKAGKKGGINPQEAAKLKMLAEKKKMEEEEDDTSEEFDEDDDDDDDDESDDGEPMNVKGINKGAIKKKGAEEEDDDDEDDDDDDDDEEDEDESESDEPKQAIMTKKAQEAGKMGNKQAAKSTASPSAASPQKKAPVQKKEESDDDDDDDDDEDDDDDDEEDEDDSDEKMDTSKSPAAKSSKAKAEANGELLGSQQQKRKADFDQNEPKKQKKGDRQEKVEAIEKQRNEKRNIKWVLVRRIPLEAKEQQIKSISPDIVKVHVRPPTQKNPQSQAVILEFESKQKAEENASKINGMEFQGQQLFCHMLGFHEHGGEQRHRNIDWRKLFVNDIPEEATLKDMTEAFPNALEYVVPKQITEIGNRYAFVFFQNEEHAEEVFMNGDKIRIAGKPISVFYAEMRKSFGGSGGGGGGGFGGQGGFHRGGRGGGGRGRGGGDYRGGRGGGGDFRGGRGRGGRGGGNRGGGRGFRGGRGRGGGGGERMNTKKTFGGDD